MSTMTEFLSELNITELLRVVWMEVALASIAATVYFTLTGWVTLPGKKGNGDAGSADPRKACSRKSGGKPSIQDPSAYQRATKALRQGNVSDAIARVLELPETMAGYVPANIAPRLLMAVAKAANFDDVMSEVSSLAGKIECRSLEAVVQEATKNKDVAACRQLQVMSRALSIPKSYQTLEALAKAFPSDVEFLRTLVEDAESPLARPFAKAVLEACTAMKEIDLVCEVFEKVSESDTKALRHVVEKAATTASSTPSAESCFAKEIRALGKSGDFDAAIAVFEHQSEKNTLLYNSIIDASVECGKVEKALEYFGEASASGMADVVTYNMAMKGYLAKGQIKEARALLHEISEKGMNPTLASYHSLINFHASAHDFDKAWALIEAMKVAGITPTAITCSIILKVGLSSPDVVKKVMSLVDAIEPMDEVLFATLADACIRTGQLKVLSNYQSRLPCQGSSLVLTAPTYGSMIKAYGQVWDLKRVWDLWTEMTNNKVQPTAITLGCMIEALVSNRCTEDAWNLMRELRGDENTRPLVNTVIYSTVLKGFANAKETDKVMAVYEEMKCEGVQPNNITFNTILNAFAQGSVMDRVPALLEDMKSATPPAEPDIVTYSTIVKGYCNSGSLDRALEILKDMQSDGKFTPDEVMYNSVLDGCAKEHRPNEALKLIDDMKKHNVTPSNYTLSIMVKLMGRCRRLNQAFIIIQDISQQYGLKVNIQVYTCLIQACFNNRQPAKAAALHDQIIKEGLYPDEMTYSALVKGCLQAGLVDQAVHLAKCAHGLASPTSKGTPPGISARCLDELVYALDSAQGKALRAEFAETRAGASSKGKGKGKNNAKGCPGSHPWRQ